MRPLVTPPKIEKKNQASQNYLCWTLFNLRNLSYSIALLICHKMFLCPISFHSVRIITMFIVFTYNVVMLITMLFLWLRIVLYVRYFDYVLPCYFTCSYHCIESSNLTLFLEPKWVEWRNQFSHVTRSEVKLSICLVGLLSYV